MSDDLEHVTRILSSEFFSKSFPKPPEGTSTHEQIRVVKLKIGKFCNSPEQKDIAPKHATMAATVHVAKNWTAQQVKSFFPFDSICHWNSSNVYLLLSKFPESSESVCTSMFWDDELMHKDSIDRVFDVVSKLGDGRHEVYKNMTRAMLLSHRTDLLPRMKPYFAKYPASLSDIQSQVMCDLNLTVQSTEGGLRRSGISGMARNVALRQLASIMTGCGFKVCDNQLHCMDAVALTELGVPLECLRCKVYNDSGESVDFVQVTEDFPQIEGLNLGTTGNASNATLATVQKLLEQLMAKGVQ